MYLPQRSHTILLLLHPMWRVHAAGGGMIACLEGSVPPSDDANFLVSSPLGLLLLCRGTGVLFVFTLYRLDRGHEIIHRR